MSVLFSVLKSQMPEDPVDPAPVESPAEAEEPTYPSLEELAQLLPQYEIHEILGIGGMGAVYKGRQIALDRWVAIKVLPAASAQNADDVQRFIKEARAMAKLVHPHIVAVFDFGQTYARHLFLVMEYVAGCDLHRRTRRKEITTERAREVIAQLCDALQFAHDRGVAHRDIKPANILITEDWKVKVADFGLARDLSAQPNPDEVEYGTPDYTAPERLIIGAAVDHRADIYALGVVIHEMLTGKTPTAAGKDAGKDLPDGFASVISKCLMSEPEARYQKASEVKIALLTATAEKQRSTTAAPVATAVPAHAATAHSIAPQPPKSYEPSLFTKLSRVMAPAGWAVACVLVIAAFAWLILKDDGGSAVATPAPEPAKAIEVIPAPVIAKPEPEKVPEPPPAPAPPMVATAKPTLPEPEKPVVTPVTVPTSPYIMPDGTPGEVARLDGHSAPVFDLALLSDQRRVASTSMDGTFRLWDLTSGKEISSAQPGIDQIARMQISADEAQALVFSYRSDKVALLDIATGKTRHTTSYPNEKLLHAFILREPQAVLITGSDDEGSPNFFLWKPDSGSTDLVPITGYAGHNYSMMLTPDGAGVILSASKKNDTTSGRFIPQLTHYSAASNTFTKLDAGPLGYITRVFGQPGAPVALVSTRTPRVVSLPDMKVLLTLPEITKDTPAILSAEIVDSGRLLLTGWDDSTLRAFEISSGEEVWRQTTPEPITDFGMSKDQRWAVLGTRYKDAKNMMDGDFDILVWRFPKWSELMSEKSLLATIAPQLIELEKHDAELADLRNKLRERAPIPTQSDLDTQRQKLDAQYVAALRRDYARLSPTDQQAIKAELELIALQSGLPHINKDSSLPASVQKLRGIYRLQLSTLESKHAEAIKIAIQSAESVLKPVIQTRENAGDKIGALRARAVLNEWQQPTAVTSGETTTGSTSSIMPSTSGTSAGTALRRPDKAGTVIAIQRAQVNSTNIIGQPGVGLVPKDLGPAVAIAGGADHAYALLPDGRMRGWGNEPVEVPPAVTDVVQIDSTDTTAIALMADGKVIAWKPTSVADAVTWQPVDGKAPVSVHAGMNGSGYVFLSDGTLQPVGDVNATPPPDLGPIKQLVHIPNRGWCGILPRDGSPVFWGNAAPPIIPLPSDLKDLISLSIASGFGVALQRDGTMTGWGQLATDQRYRVRKFTSATKVYHDYADRVFPVHRADHSWELAPNPNIPEYVSEDRSSVVEGRLRGAIDAVFGRQYVIALRP